MQIQYTKNHNPGKFELGTALSLQNRSIMQYMNKISCRFIQDVQTHFFKDLIVEQTSSWPVVYTFTKQTCNI